MNSTEINYKIAGQSFKAALYCKDETLSNQPAVLVAHAGEGRNEVTLQNAEKIAEMGYVTLAIDLYGDAKVATDLDTMLANAMPLVKDRDLLLERMQAGLEALASQSQVDKNKISAVGFCLGGMAVLDLARSGANVPSVVSVHGILAEPEQNKKQCAAKVLVLHGYDDPQAPLEQAEAFMAEMTTAKVDWQLHYFGGTKHSFSNPKAADIGVPEMGREYSEVSSKRSWQLIESFLAEKL